MGGGCRYTFPNVQLLRLFVYLSLSSFVCSYAANASLGIDWGEEYVQVSIAYPGHKPDILLNDTGSRKFQNAVYLNGAVRVFDKDALSLAIKNPQWVIYRYAHALGLVLEDSQDRAKIIDYLQQHNINLNGDYSPYQYKVIKGQLYVAIKENIFTPLENVAAHFLNYIREIALAKMVHTKSIKSVDETVLFSTVIGVPCNYTLEQMNAIKFAANVGGLNVVRLVRGATAAAWYRTFEMSEKNHKLLVYDLGSFGANVGIVNIEIAQSKRDKTVVELLACTLVPNVGGAQHDFLLAQHLRSTYESKTNANLSQHPRALQKLLRAATKAKVNLTITSQANVSIEGLTPGSNMHEKVTRAEFEALLTPTLSQLRDPVQRALDIARLKIEDLTDVEVIGGAWRVPLVLEELKKALNPHPLGFHLNAEESIAMGTGFLAAMYNPFFRMKPVDILEHAVYPVTIDVILGTKATGPVLIHQALYDTGTIVEFIKVVRVDVNVDFVVILKELDRVLETYTIKGVKSAASKKIDGETFAVYLEFLAPGDASIYLSKAFGVLASIPSEAADTVAIEDVADAHKPEQKAEVEVEAEAEAKETLQEDQKAESSDDQAGTATDTHTASDANSDAAADSNSGAQDVDNDEEHDNKEEGQKPPQPEPTQPETKATQQESKAAPQEIKTELKFTTTKGSKKYDANSLKAATDDLGKFLKQDKHVKILNASRNNLESAIYRYRSALNNSDFKDYSGEQVAEELATLLAQHEDWFEDKAHAASVQEFDIRIKAIQGLVQPVHERQAAYKQLNASIASTTKSLLNLQEQLDKLLAEKPNLREHVQLVEQFEKVVGWWKETQQQHAKHPLHTNPLVDAQEIDDKVSQAKSALDALVEKSQTKDEL